MQVLALCDIHPLKQRLTGRNGADWGTIGGREGGSTFSRISKIFEAHPPDTPFTALELGDVLDRSRSFWSAPVLGGEFPHVFFIFVAAVHDDGYVYGLKYRVTVLVVICVYISTYIDTVENG